MTNMDAIMVTGSSGIIGHAVVAALKEAGYQNVLAPTHCEVDLLNAEGVGRYVDRYRPAAVIHCAALSGSADVMRKNGADILACNILMQTNVMRAAAAADVEKLVYLGSGSVYGPLAKVPFTETEAIQSIQGGSLEAYAVSKIAGVVLCKQYQRLEKRAFVSVLPTHVYGCYDAGRKKDAVVDTIICNILEAKRKGLEKVQLDIWGSGKLCVRQYIHVEDCARAIVHVMEHYEDEIPVNLAADDLVTMDEIAHMAKQALAYEGALVYLTDRKEVASKRVMSTHHLHEIGFHAHYTMEKGIRQVCRAYEEMCR